MSGPFNSGDIVQPSVTRLDAGYIGDEEYFIRDGHPGADFPLSTPTDWPYYVGNPSTVVQYDPGDHTLLLRHEDGQKWWWPAEGVVLA